MRSNTFMGVLLLVLGLILLLIGMRKRGALLVKELQAIK